MKLKPFSKEVVSDSYIYIELLSAPLEVIINKYKPHTRNVYCKQYKTGGKLFSRGLPNFVSYSGRLKKKVIMIDNQNETRLPHLKKNGEKAVLGSLPSVNPVVPAGVVSPLLHATVMAATAPHGVGWQHALLFNL